MRARALVLLAIGLLSGMFVAGPAHAQGVAISAWPTPNPSASIGQGVLLGNVGGTLGVGGTTVKIPVTSLAPPLAAPIAQLVTPSMLAAPTTAAAATFPTPTGTTPGYTLPGSTTMGVALSPKSGGVGATTGAVSVTGIVATFGDSLPGNGGNGTTSGYCAPFNTLTTPTSVNGCAGDQIAQYYGVQEMNLGVPGSCLGTYSSFVPLATTAITNTSGAQTFGVTPADIGLFYVGEVVVYDTGATQDKVTVTAVNTSTYQVTATGFTYTHSVGAHIGDYCSGGNAGITRYSTLVTYCTTNNLVWFEYNFLNEIYHNDLGFAAAGGLASGIAQLKTMIDACKAAGPPLLVMQDTTHQTEAQGITVKVALEGQARAAVQALAAQEGLPMARAYETLTPCWYDALIPVGVTMCAANDGIHPSNGLTGLTAAITSTGSQAAAVFNLTGSLYPVGSSITVDTGTQAETITVTASSSGTITAPFAKTHAQFAPIYSNTPTANVGNTLLAQAVENATFSSTISNGAAGTTYAATTVPQVLNQPTLSGCTYVLTPGVTPPAGCTSGNGVLLVTTTLTSGEIYFGGMTAYGTLQFVGSVPNFQMSSPLSVNGTVSGVGLVSTADANINISDNYGIKINDSAGTGAALALNETATSGGTAQDTLLLAGFPTINVNGVTANVFGIRDSTGSQLQLAIDTAGDLSVRGKLVAEGGVYPNSPTGASWSTGTGAPSSGACTTATAGALYTVSGITTLGAALYVCVNVSGTASWNAVTIP